MKILILKMMIMSKEMLRKMKIMNKIVIIMKKRRKVKSQNQQNLKCLKLLVKSRNLQNYLNHQK